MRGATQEDLTRRTFVTALLLLVAVAALLRGLFPSADPPTHATVGIVWHDEGAWTHNARNRVLFGAWRQDAWNPMFIAPVFTALEYAAFEAFGVGVRQARLVPQTLGVLSVALLAMGIARVAGRRAGIIAGALLATNYVYVMWNRAALMEGPMTAFMVGSWYCYVRAEVAPRWAWGAAALALTAFFTKASAAFFVAALGIDAMICLALASRERPLERRLGAVTILAFVVCGIGALLMFVAPNWADYRFYNWQMSVTRKPAYGIGPLLDRASWIPIVHDFFTRMWLLVVASGLAVASVAVRWRTARPWERLLVSWLILGLAELVVHDSGNERRYVMFIPALAALTGVVLADPAGVVAPFARLRRPWLGVPLILGLAYLALGSVVRLAFLYEVRPGVWLGAAAAVGATALVVAFWPRLAAWFGRQSTPPVRVLIVVALAAGGDLAQYVQWLRARTHENYEASLAVGRALPEGTLVHGKLANGLALENGIRPVFVGREFGNYADRRARDDVRYILTYVSPRVGYEGSVIRDVIDAYPGRTIIMTFDVAETATGHDRAALIDKFGSPTRTGHSQHRAQH